MTGYSTARAEEGGVSLSLSLKGTNHRYLDLQMRLAAGLDFIEPEIRRILKERVQRGHVEVSVSVENRNGASLQLDRKLLEAYLKTCQSIRQDFGLSAEPDLVALLRIPGVVTGGSELNDAAREQITSILGKALAEAASRFNEMREREGETLARDLAARIARLDELGEVVSGSSASMAPAFRKRMEKRVRELVKGVGMEPARLAQEVTALAMRSDITEELTRFKSHVEQAKGLLNEGKEVGKRMDFLLQEMNREANTMLSKTTDVPDVGAKIQNAAIEMKVEIEKLREQVQNIE
ncbi:MAG: YicC/YloC family endoribonuclease [Terriglobia bacterium]